MVIEAAWAQVRAALALGMDVGDVGAVPMALRTIVVYGISLAIVRLGNKRFLSDASAFDVIVGIMLGSIMSRAINGSAPLLPTVVAGVVLVGLHWLFATLAFRTDWFGSIVKGDPVLLVKDGDLQWDGMRRGKVSPRDLEQALRMQGEPADIAKIQLAYLERNGQVSIVTRKEGPRTTLVPVEDGVQTVRIELG
jgi:uncharacterized membrane protein YcaP (DUF421 family)